MAGSIMLDNPWKTDRIKRGSMLIKIEPGDSVIVGGQEFTVWRILNGGRLVIQSKRPGRHGGDGGRRP